MTCQLSKYL